MLYRSWRLACVVLLGSAPPVQAADSFPAVAHAGALGVGSELPRERAGFRLRLGFHSLDDSFIDRAGGLDDDLELDPASSALADWHPARGGLRIGGGTLTSSSATEGRNDPMARSFTGGTASTDGDIAGRTVQVRYADPAPYGGVGWDAWFGVEDRIGLSFDVGVIFQGAPHLSLSAGGSPAGDGSQLSSLAVEERPLQAESDRDEYYPVVIVALVFRF